MREAYQRRTLNFKRHKRKWSGLGPERWFWGHPLQRLKTALSFSWTCQSLNSKHAIPMTSLPFPIIRPALPAYRGSSTVIRPTISQHLLDVSAGNNTALTDDQHHTPNTGRMCTKPGVQFTDPRVVWGCDEGNPHSLGTDIPPLHLTSSPSGQSQNLRPKTLVRFIHCQLDTQQKSVKSIPKDLNLIWSNDVIRLAILSSSSHTDEGVGVEQRGWEGLEHGAI